MSNAIGVAQILATDPPVVARVRVRAQRRVLWLRHLWATTLSDEDRGMAISHGEVDRLLTGRADLAGAEEAFYLRDREARALAEPIERSERALSEDPAWSRLRDVFGLSQRELDLLALAAACELDPSLRRVYGYLNDDAQALYATPWLAASLWQWSGPVAFGPESALVRRFLARPADGWSGAWSPTTPWAADPLVVNWLARGEIAEPALGGAFSYWSAASAPERECLYPAELAQLQEFIRSLEQVNGEDSSSIEVELVGLPGSGRRTLARQLGASLGRDLIVVDAPRLLGGDATPALALERIDRAGRAARLAGAALFWHEAGDVDPKVWRSGSEAAGLVFFGVTEPLARAEPTRATRVAATLPTLTRGQRIRIWQQLTEVEPPAPVADWKLTPAEIAHAAEVAPAGHAAVVESCRRLLYRSPGELFTPLPRPYDWPDIVLTAPVRQHLEELEAQARLRWPVYEEWGFARLVPLGVGISALFAGPSGTGKTMAAQVLARALDLELYRVDLAGVMNKYIGETEKRLKQVFDACERANVLLFFDEADALFGQRTQVKDAHDRFANIEIDYLLQRMEQFDGIAILATNRKGDLDQAFLRRIRFVVDFLPPGPAERLALWQKALLPRAPDGTELLGPIDWQLLADRLTMTGADIKAAALGAAFLARSRGRRIGMRDVLHAAGRELVKHGVVIRPEEWPASLYREDDDVDRSA